MSSYLPAHGVALASLTQLVVGPGRGGVHVRGDSDRAVVDPVSRASWPSSIVALSLEHIWFCPKVGRHRNRGRVNGWANCLWFSLQSVRAGSSEDALRELSLVPVTVALCGIHRFAFPVGLAVGAVASATQLLASCTCRSS